ncbi:MAG: hypothetical protein DME26_19865, partial [Verrucomicrobia bacterium]
MFAASAARIDILPGFVQTILIGLISFKVSGANLEWTQEPGYRSAALPVPNKGKAGFTLLAPAITGLNFTNVLTDAKAA